MSIFKNGDTIENEEWDVSFLSENNIDDDNFAAQIAEGQLMIDVAQTTEMVIVTVVMAGTEPADISLHLVNDVMTIRGKRTAPIGSDAEYFIKECYWGNFSRTIVLPVEVKGELASAEYRLGILTIRLPKKISDNQIPITIVEE